MTQYQIHIQGHLDKHWETLFSGFELHHTFSDDGDAITIISGDVIDQAALYGIINHLRNLGLQLVSIHPDPKQH